MSFLKILSTALNLQKICINSSQQTLFKLDFIINAKPDSSLINHCLNSVRYNKKNNDRVFRKIRGGGRPVPEGVVPPEPRKYGWRPVYPEDGKYTTRPLPIIKMGGRHPETGRVVVRTIGGGHQKFHYWVDYKREGPADGTYLEERVFKITTDPVRTARVALVGSGDHKRWIIAAENTKVGDVVKTLGVVPRMPIRPVDGDAYPVGALPMGTLIHHIEVTPGDGALFCRAAGSAGQFIRRVDNKCLVQLPSKRQLLLDEKCMVVAGRASNITHASIPIGSPQRLRWLGKRPRSGLWHRKDGYCGRKINPPKSILDTFQPKLKEPEFYNLTFKGGGLSDIPTLKGFLAQGRPYLAKVHQHYVNGHTHTRKALLIQKSQLTVAKLATGEFRVRNSIQPETIVYVGADAWPKCSHVSMQVWKVETAGSDVDLVI